MEGPASQPNQKQEGLGLPVGKLFDRLIGHDVYEREVKEGRNKGVAAMMGVAAAMFPGVRLMVENAEQGKKVEGKFGWFAVGWTIAADTLTTAAIAFALAHPEALAAAGSIKLTTDMLSLVTANTAVTSEE